MPQFRLAALRTLLAVICLVAADRHLAAQPPRGSHLPPDKNSCAQCHGEKDLWGGDTLRLYVPAETLAHDVHFVNGVNCSDCHGGDPSSFDVPQAHAKEVGKGESGVLPFRLPLTEVWKACGNCHKEARQGLDTGAHTKAGAKNKQGQGTPLLCSGCHGEKAHGMLPVTDSRSPVFEGNLVSLCGSCHKEPRLGLLKGVHAKVGARDAQGRGLPLACNKCHAKKAHDILPVQDARSPVYPNHQVQTCGDCHPDYLATYRKTVHGQGLFQAGLLVVAVCADCHGAHGIYYAADRRSKLNAANVASTCGECHRFIEERLQRSVHARGRDPAVVAESAPWPGKPKREPTCTSCHQGHQMLRPESAAFQQLVSNRCGNCHAEFSRRYGMSLHGQLTRLGYMPAAKCSDCHGAHDILPIGDPQSRLAPGPNRLATCRQCHLFAVTNFSNYDPHADYADRAEYPLLYGVYHGLSDVLWLFFAFFAIHAVLWFLRSLVHTLQHGRHKTLLTKKAALMRFSFGQRLLYAVLIVCFVGLTLTGVPLKFGNQPWAQSLARALGGFGSTSVWHRFFAVLAIVGCTAHVVSGAKRIARLRSEKRAWKTILLGPDSPVPGSRDARDFWGMVRWFLGLGRRPVFEAWTYWEKLDYWALCGAVVVIGFSGLMLWYPNVFCVLLPGRALNVAKMVHSQFAVLIASLVFVVRAFNTHFRPEKFPMDLSVLTGLVSEEHLRKYRPEYVRRLEQAGELEAIRTTAPSRGRLRSVLLAGLLVFSLGLCLLAVILLASLGE